MVCPGKELWGQFFSHQQLLEMCTRISDGSVVHELVQLNESFNWTNWTSSQFWNKLVQSFPQWTTLKWTLWLWWTDDWMRICIRKGIFRIFLLKWKRWSYFKEWGKCKKIMENFKKIDILQKLQETVHCNA